MILQRISIILTMIALSTYFIIYLRVMKDMVACIRARRAAARDLKSPSMSAQVATTWNVFLKSIRLFIGPPFRGPFIISLHVLHK